MKVMHGRKSIYSRLLNASITTSVGSTKRKRNMEQIAVSHLLKILIVSRFGLMDTRPMAPIKLNFFLRN